jgi:hypothetical protein
VRPQLIPFSWELLNEIKVDKDFTLIKYIKDIDLFFCLKSEYFANKLTNYNKIKLPHTRLGKHFIIIKKKYRKFLEKYIKYKNLSVKQIYLDKIEILYQINIILDEIMEWYICACIELNQSESIIIHTGLAHSEKILNWLIIHYQYIILNKYGINTLNEISNNLNGCIQLPYDIDKQFGGY